jgi:CBS domain-containing protein
MKIRDVMSYNPTRIDVDATMQRAAEVVSLTQVSDLMVTDSDNHFIGVLSEGDLIRAVMPKFDEIMQGGGSLREAFDMFIENGRTVAIKPISSIVIGRSDLVIVHPDDEVLKAAGSMVSRQIRRLPVVNADGKLVGTVSRADVCRGILHT